MDGFAKYLVRRLFQFFLVIFLGVSLAFLITNLSPVNPVEQSVALMTSFGAGSHASFTTAPGSTYSAGHSSVIGLSPFNVITGGFVSTTFTVRVNDTALFPLASVAS